MIVPPIPERMEWGWGALIVKGEKVSASVGLRGARTGSEQASETETGFHDGRAAALWRIRMHAQADQSEGAWSAAIFLNDNVRSFVRSAFKDFP